MDPHWTEPLEKIVRKCAEHALALSWAHEASQRWTSSWNTRLMFPSIILSSLVGIGSVGSSALLPFDNASTLVGIVSMSVGVLQTIQNYFAFAKRSESHRIASLQYSKLHSQLSLQLALPRNERKSAEEIIDFIKAETEKLADVAPIIPMTVKEDFKKKFHGLDDYSIPPLLNGLDRVEITAMNTIPTGTTPHVYPAPRPIIRVEV